MVFSDFSLLSVCCLVMSCYLCLGCLGCLVLCLIFRCGYMACFAMVWSCGFIGLSQVFIWNADFQEATRRQREASSGLQLIISCDCLVIVLWSSSPFFGSCYVLCAVFCVVCCVLCWVELRCVALCSVVFTCCVVFCIVWSCVGCCFVLRGVVLWCWGRLSWILLCVVLHIFM